MDIVASMNHLKFHRAPSEHVPAVVEPMAAFNRHFNYPFDAVKAEGHLRTFVSSEQLGRIWIATMNDEIIGYVILAFGLALNMEDAMRSLTNCTFANHTAVRVWANKFSILSNRRQNPWV